MQIKIDCLIDWLIDLDWYGLLITWKGLERESRASGLNKYWNVTRVMNSEIKDKNVKVRA